MLGQGCSYIEAADASPAALVLPGDLVTNCTASAVWLVQHVERGGVAVLVAAGLTLGDSWKAGRVYRVHVSHLQHAPQHVRDSLFEDLGSVRAGPHGLARPTTDGPDGAR
jgi:hypothetical protein